MDIPYELLDSYGDTIEGFREQDRLMQGLYNQFRLYGLGGVKHISMMYYDEEEQGHLLGYGSEARFQVWFKALDDLKIALRLAGTDIIGLHEFVQFEDISIEYEVCDCPLTYLCPQRYTVYLDGEARGQGYTRLEALAKGYVKEKTNGGFQDIQNHSPVSV